MRKRKIYRVAFAILFSIALWAGPALSLYAADTGTDEDTGTDAETETTETDAETETDTAATAVFDGKSISGEIYISPATLLPGDTTSSSVTIRTGASTEAANWYLSSGVVESLEESKSVAAGAGYTYKLTYRRAGAEEESVLYSSEKIEGGEDDEGTDRLKEALAALGSVSGDDLTQVSAWFYLDTLKAGESGTITLTVALDGETTANSYQLSQAELYLQLAAETVSSTEPTTTTKTKTKHRTIYETETVTLVQINENEVPLSDTSFTTTVSDVPKTGDETKLWLFVTLFGLGCLGLAVCLAGKLRGRKKERGRGA